MPLRYVFHHIQPKEAGGPTTLENTVPLCDGCHYSTHRLLYHLAKDYLSQTTGGPPVPLGPVPRQAQLDLARRGLSACVAAKTVPQIPNEG